MLTKVIVLASPELFVIYIYIYIYTYIHRHRHGDLKIYVYAFIHRYRHLVSTLAHRSDRRLGLSGSWYGVAIEAQVSFEIRTRGRRLRASQRPALKKLAVKLHPQ